MRSMRLLLCPFVALLVLPAIATAGLNAGAIAHLYWQVGSHGPADTSRYSADGQPVMLVTVQGLRSFRGADVQVLAVKSSVGSLPDAWHGNGTGGCNDGSFVFARGGRGGTFPNAFTASPAVPGLVAPQNQEFYNYNNCLTPGGTGLLWLSAAGSLGEPRNPSVEYAVWSVTFDLRGQAGGGAVTCSGDLSDPAGPIGVQLQARSRVPCTDPDQGAVIQLLDENNEVDFIPIAAGQSVLYWENHDPPRISDFSPPTAQVLFPNGGEAIGVGTFLPIHLLAADDIGISGMDVELSLDDGASYPVSIAANAPYLPNLVWQVPNLATTRGRIRLTVRDAAGNQTVDASDGPFSLRDFTPPTVSVISPNGGEVIPPGGALTVLSQASDNIGITSMTIQFSTNGGGSFSSTPLYVGPYSASAVVNVPALSTTRARIRVLVTDAAGNGGSDMSDNDFRIEILPPPTQAVQVQFPNGGENLPSNSATFIAISYHDSSGPATLSLALSTDGGATASIPITPGPVAFSTTYPWHVPFLSTHAARVVATVVDSAGHAHTDASDANFSIFIPDTIAPMVQVTSPNGGERWAPGSAHWIRVHATDDRQLVSITLKLSTDGGVSYPTAVPTLSGYHDSTLWIVPNLSSEHCRIQALVDDGTQASADISDADFSIALPIVPPQGPYVLVQFPNGGEDFRVTDPVTVFWTDSGLVGPGRITIRGSQDGGLTFLDLATDLPDNHHADFADLSQLYGPGCRIQVQVIDSAGNVYSDLSDHNFIVRDKGGLTATLASDFNAESAEGAALLRWTVGEASRVRSLEISRRPAGHGAYEQLGVMQARTGPMEFRDTRVAPGVDYEYRILLTGVGVQPTSLVVRLTVLAPKFGLGSAFPNPFRRELGYQYAMDQRRDVRLEVRDVRGTLVKTLEEGRQTGGLHQGIWDGLDRSGRPTPSGVYFLRLIAGDRVSSRRVVRL